nr:MAG TPA: hypothetical protein [Caudoviricetes sp.]
MLSCLVSVLSFTFSVYSIFAGSVVICMAALTFAVCALAFAGLID